MEQLLVGIHGHTQGSYSADNVGAIFNSFVTPAGTNIYMCPAATNATQCGGIDDMCGGKACITPTSAEYDTLSLWIANGGLN